MVEQKMLEDIIREYNEKIQTHCFNLSSCLSIIEALRSLLHTALITTEIETILVGLIAYSFSFDDMDEECRSNFCQIWIDGIEKLFNGESFAFDISLSNVLFAQVEHNLNDIYYKGETTPSYG